MVFCPRALWFKVRGVFGAGGSVSTHVKMYLKHQVVNSPVMYT